MRSVNTIKFGVIGPWARANRCPFPVAPRLLCGSVNRVLFSARPISLPSEEKIYPENHDWIKLCGFAGSLNARRHSIMFTFRHRILPSLGSVAEFGFYCHYPGDKRVLKALRRDDLDHETEVFATVSRNQITPLFVIDLDLGLILQYTPEDPTKTWMQILSSDEPVHSADLVPIAALPPQLIARPFWRTVVPWQNTPRMNYTIDVLNLLNP